MYAYYELVLSGFVNGILADTVYGKGKTFVFRLELVIHG